MRHVTRQLAGQLERATRGFAAVLLTGPRRAGKTTLLRRLFPKASYRLLEDPDVVARARSDPHGFLDELELPAILDEIQNVPELPAGPMRGVSESMAGRAAVFHLLPLSIGESPKVSLLRGGFPEVVARPSHAATWFRSYVQTYLERDVRAVTQVRDIAIFRRFIALVGQSRGANPEQERSGGAARGVGADNRRVAVDPRAYRTDSARAAVLREFGKRLIKSPKLYFVDSGMACHLLGVETVSQLAESPFRGPLFEGFVGARSQSDRSTRGIGRSSTTSVTSKGSR